MINKIVLNLHKININQSLSFYVLVLLFYLFVAYKSSGYHNPDEHFQIIEFANYKFGGASKNDLAWEFAAKIRSGLQPFIGFLILKALSIIGINNPYITAFIMRGFTALLMILSIRYFLNSFADEIRKPYQNLLTILSFFLWYLPYINVRFSSETWSGIFILISISFLKKKYPFNKNHHFFVLGILFAISVLFRFQSAVLVAGCIGWLIIIAKIPLSNLFALFFGGGFVMFFGVIIDEWMYGAYTLSFYNYFHVNLIEDVASQYGVSPWYEIFSYIAFGPGPIGWLIIISLVTISIMRPKHILIWAILPFLFIHMIIPHKELRFLFPLANFSAFILMYSLSNVTSFRKLLKSKVVVSIMISFAVINVFGIYAISSKGAGKGKITVGKFIQKRYQGKKINILYAHNLNPYSDWAYPRDRFYTHSNDSLSEIVSVWNLEYIPQQNKNTVLILSPEDLVGQKTLDVLKGKGFKKVYQTLDPINHFINSFYDADINNREIFVFEYNGQ